MNIEPQVTKPISDDQELAKVLAGVSKEADDLAIEEPAIAMPAPEPVVAPIQPEEPQLPVPNSAGNDLNSIKKDALTDLRPLVDKLDVAPEEKFDIYLLLLRSTDDKSLIAPAYASARNIADETRRAQALLDIIKEIDYLSNPPTTSS